VREPRVARRDLPASRQCLQARAPMICLEIGSLYIGAARTCRSRRSLKTRESLNGLKYILLSQQMVDVMRDVSCINTGRPAVDVEEFDPGMYKSTAT
jgi:hypothetical protein